MSEIGTHEAVFHVYEASVAGYGLFKNLYLIFIFFYLTEGAHVPPLRQPPEDIPPIGAISFHIITKISKNIKNYLITLVDKNLLKKRFCIETIFGFLKNSMNLEHTRHRSPINFLVKLIQNSTKTFLQCTYKSEFLITWKLKKKSFGITYCIALTA